VTNSSDRRADRGDVYATRRHRSISTLVYDLPFGTGRRFMTQASRAVDAILGGWSLSSIVTLQSGPYLTPVMSGGDPSGTNGPNRGTGRPDRIGTEIFPIRRAMCGWIATLSSVPAGLLGKPVQLRRGRGAGPRSGAHRPFR